MFVLILMGIAFWILAPKLGETYNEIPEVFRKANKTLIPLLLIAQTLYYFGDGWLSKIVLKMGGYNLRLRDTLRIAILGVVGNQAFPVLGGVALSYYFYRKLKLPHEAIVFLVISWTFLVYIMYGIFFFLSLFFAPVSPLYFLPPPALITCIFVVITFFLAIYYLLKDEGRKLISLTVSLSRILNGITMFLFKRDLIDSERPKRFIPRLYQTFRMLENHYRELPKAFLASLIFYLGNILTLYFSFFIFGQKCNFFHIVYGYSLSLLLSALTLVPQTPGVLLASLSVIFTSLGIPAHIVILSGALYRAFSYWLPLAVGVIVLINMRREARKIGKEAMDE
ncbi:flippase-like domain-containing protein [bacterium]|nr:flippase-like domain-containing protein [bacterium]